MPSRIREFERAYFEAATEGLRIIAETLLGMAQRDAPIETGFLRGSGAIRPEIGAGVIFYVVFFPVVYAAVQHERTDFQHRTGGKSHYLSDPLKALGGRFEALLGAYIARRLAGF